MLANCEALNANISALSIPVICTALNALIWAEVNPLTLAVVKAASCVTLNIAISALSIPAICVELNALICAVVKLLTLNVVKAAS